MHFDKVGLDDLLTELEELPSDWMDEKALALLAHLKVTVGRLRELDRPVTGQDIADELREDPKFLDVCRLFLGKGQEPVAHMLCDELTGPRMSWPKLKSVARQQPEVIAAALSALELPRIIQDHLERQWQTEDILIERYRMSRGRAIAGQKRGRALEDEVEAVLHELDIPSERGVTFVG